MPQNGPVVIQPNASALVIIDMQNFFLHESLNGDPEGRAIVRTSLELKIMNDSYQWFDLQALFLQRQLSP